MLLKKFMFAYDSWIFGEIGTLIDIKLALWARKLSRPYVVKKLA
jgi:hypothetical protein